MKITDQCLNCGMCSGVCPHGAIVEGGTKVDDDNKEQPPIDHFFILKKLCTECKTCTKVCPINCIVED